jgi:hypothetical protein
MLATIRAMGGDKAQVCGTADAIDLNRRNVRTAGWLAIAVRQQSWPVSHTSERGDRRASHLPQIR